MSSRWPAIGKTLRSAETKGRSMSQDETGGIYGQRALNLHAQRRSLIDSIEDAHRLGRSTEQLKADLVRKQAELDSFRAYLAAHHLPPLACRCDALPGDAN